MLRDVQNLRFAFVTGKGGVGKTTMSALIGKALASRGKRVLIAMCNAKERVSDLFGCTAIGPEIAQVMPNLWAVNMQPQRCLEEYGSLKLRSPGLVRALFRNDVVREFFRAVPGLYDWSMLGKAWFHTTQLQSGLTTDRADPPTGDAFRFDIVLLDAPATGHGLDMLRVPQIVLKIAPPGMLRRDAERGVASFKDPSRTGVVVVTLPEEMPMIETLELCEGLKTLGVPLASVVVNQLLPELLSPDERGAILQSGDQADLSALYARAFREHLQSQVLQRLAAEGLPVSRVLFDPNLQQPAALIAPDAAFAREHFAV